MLVFSPATYAINAAPYASLGRQAVGEENTELKRTTFPPAQQLEQAAHSLNRRSLDEQRNFEIERDRLMRFRAGIHRDGATNEPPVGSGELPNDYSDDAAQPLMFQASFERDQVLKQVQFGQESLESRGALAEEGNYSLALELREARERAERDEEAERMRREVMDLVARRSIQLNQRLLEIALSHDEVDVGEILNYRA